MNSNASRIGLVVLCMVAAAYAAASMVSMAGPQFTAAGWFMASQFSAATTTGGHTVPDASQVFASRGAAAEEQAPTF